ncbi:uncharacterized protein DNG_08233 [Cephalotrichum gorgonifer]|uniref:Major facilitator superfamily (MFS) profile domain-containing protein n=1 Tax=Cephalotrichum gorgonifer TaxID=2041049 RepID=A0AAE8N341_9PEZI|nr:uncharacterized protein DNG_08233 [Cephalotrichum gorgonifer]
MEQERLITSSGDPGAESAAPPSSPPRKKPEVRWSDLPNKDQLFLLAICRLSEPLSNVCLLPYIFYLVRSVLPRDPDSNTDSTASATPGASESESARISEYSGLLVASFPLAQFAVSLAWGYISDARGRRPSILLGLLVSVVANAAFGLSRSLGALFFWRTLAGVANGNVGLMRGMTAEVVRERRFQTKAFLLLPLVFNSGMVFSLAVGGILADPVTNLPWAFGPRGFLNFAGGEKGVAWAVEYPYALPGLMNAGMLGTALVLSWLWLAETLPGKEGTSDIGLRAGGFLVRLARNVCGVRDHTKYMPVADEEAPSTPGTSTPPSPASTAEAGEATKPSSSPVGAGPISEKPPPRAARLPFRKIFTRDVLTAMVAFGLLPLHNSAFMHIFPVYLSTPPAAPDTPHTLLSFTGGLGLRSSAIGLWLSAFGVGGILLQLFIYPRIQGRVGTLGVLRIALVIFPAVYVLAPYLSLAAGAARWAGLGLVICGQIAARTMAIPSTVILLTEAAPAKNVLGTVHGAGNMLVSLARAVGPAVGGVVFAWGVENGVVGAVWWMYLVCVALVALTWTFTLQRSVEE